MHTIGDIYLRYHKATVGATSQMNSDISDLVAQLSKLVQVREPVQEPTLNDLYALYMKYAKGHCRSWRKMEQYWQTYLLKWSERSARSIKRSHVQDLHYELGSTVGPTTANRVIEMLCTLYNYACDNLDQEDDETRLATSALLNTIRPDESRNSNWSKESASLARLSFSDSSKRSTLSAMK